MARAIWTGSIGFGLVNVPVQLFSAVEDKEIRFHEFAEGTKDRVRYKRVNERTGREVPFEKIAKGYEVSRGRFVMLEPEELEAVEPGRSRTIEIEDFVQLEDVDPIYFERTYYLAPSKDKGAEHAYALLLDAMGRTGKIAIGTFVMRTKQYLAAVRPGDGILLLETMHFADEIRDAHGVANLPRKVRLAEKERRIAEQLIRSLTTDWDPSRYRDTYRERVLELVKAKGKGNETVPERPKPEPAALDLLAALQASLKGAEGGRRRQTRSRHPRSRSRPRTPGRTPARPR